METLKTQGIVLRHYNYSENSLLVYFFTEKLGKLKTIVKGAKKPRGRFFGKLELCSIVDLLVLHRTRSDLHVLTDAALVEELEPLRSDLAKFAHAMVLLELVDSAFEVESANKVFYDDFLEGLRLLARQPMDLWIPVVIQLKMLHALGLLPEQDTCQECGKLMEGQFYFSSQAGASLCRGCISNRGKTVAGKSWQLPYLKEVAVLPMAQCTGLSLSEDQKRQFFAWTRNILDGVVHKRIRSYTFLSQVGF